MSQGFTTTISALAMQTPLVVTSKDNGGDPIRSVTLGNQTSSTTAVIYGSAGSLAAPLFAVVPGQFATIPIQESATISIVFVCAKGAQFDGGVFVHVDPNALAASGYQVAATAPLWVWDTSKWDGGGVWST